MSYDRSRYPRGGGGRRRNRDYEERRAPIETPFDRLRNMVVKLGEVDAEQEVLQLLHQVLGWLNEQYDAEVRAHGYPVTALGDALRIAITEQPFKIPFYVPLIRLMYFENNGDHGLGRRVVEELWRGCQAALDGLARADGRAWPAVRAHVAFFAHLSVAGLVDATSYAGLLRALAAVLDEVAVSHARAKRVAVCAAEGALAAAPVLDTSVRAEIATAIQSCADTVRAMHTVVRPLPAPEAADELLDVLLAVLRAEDTDGDEYVFPRPYLRIAADSSLPSDFVPFSLPVVLVPPEVVDLDEGAVDTSRDDWPEYYLRLFGNDVTPNVRTPAGYAVRAALADMIGIYEVNRKECARLLLEFPKWAPAGSFQPRPDDEVYVPVPGKDWQLESTVIEVRPTTTHPPVYYSALVTELCKLAPATVGPAVGKAIRALYRTLGDGLDAEVGRRYTDWFALHMSNFGFQWVWKEWYVVPDLVLPVQHPRRTFMRRAVELEIRLAYHERVLKTLPPPMQRRSARVAPARAPGGRWEFGGDAHSPPAPIVAAAQRVLDLLRGRAPAADAIAAVARAEEDLANADVEDYADTKEEEVTEKDAFGRDIVVRDFSLLHVGSRSFSHLLNAIERYLPLLRSLAGQSSSKDVGRDADKKEGDSRGSPAAKRDILNATAAFWRENSQLVVIVFDKLMQYQVVDPSDVVSWVFYASHDTETATTATVASPGLTGFAWEVLRAALDKANGRVALARRRVAQLQKEDDERRARARAKDAGEAMARDEEKEAKHEAEDAQLAAALRASAILTLEQKTALARALEGFVSFLCPEATTATNTAAAVLGDDAWENRGSWGNAEWRARETWSWYKHFCCLYAPYLRTYSTTLATVAFARLESSIDPAAELVKSTWRVCIDGE
ncbi:hypothetical protein FISHEDRAFT_45060 [Fistulina hepatica ATCC 64428]|uniref:MIF4G domain-containing protein n=1 Tax=Fistulina hepatica ATCC 64428 TaxID=1128425 RepID=A0A0D7ACD2_9AGAR|nr:hypothetical protein FISHEDRAFT_45060 [Fistulina hepatica ATCC 64428]